MNDAPKLSIIIPLYNSEEWIEDCLNSIFSQFSKSNLYNLNFVEIIVIDDCSNDNSLKIACSFSREYQKCMHLISSKTNKGPGQARNIGLKKAKGDYIFFLDSDDRLNNNFMDEILKKINLNHCYDLIVLGYSVFSEKKRILMNNSIPSFNENEDHIFRKHLLLMNGLGTSPWNYIFSRSFLKNNNITFPENIFFEDVIFVTKAVFFQKKIGTIQNPVYEYTFRESSITQSMDRKKIDDSFTAHFQIKDFLTSQNVFKEYKEEFLIRLLVYCIAPCFNGYFRMKKTEKTLKTKTFMRNLRKSDLMSVSNIITIKKYNQDIKLFDEAYKYLLAIRKNYIFFTATVRFLKFFENVKKIRI